MPFQNLAMMNDDELKTSLAKKLASDKEKLDFQSPNFCINMEREINKFEKRIRSRDRREILTALGLLFFLCNIGNFSRWIPKNWFNSSKRVFYLDHFLFN